jgi:membrane fusion protein (multidrug efflux system)
VRARIADANQTVSPGASVRVLVPVGPARKAIAVPVSALRKGPAGDHVFVIAADPNGRDRVSVRPVRSGTVVGDEVLVLDGLEAGERVATSGSFKLRESALVAIADDTPELAKQGH